MNKKLSTHNASATAPDTVSPGVLNLFWTFMILGITSYGMAILQNLRTVPVKKGWLTVEELFAMTIVFSEIFVHVRHLGAVRGAIRGIMAVFVGLLVTVVLSLGHHTFVAPETFVLGAAALVLVRYFKWDLLPVFGLGVAFWVAYLAWPGWPASLS